MSSNPPIIELRRVSKYFSAHINDARKRTMLRVLASPFSLLPGMGRKEFAAVDDVSLNIARGERVVIAGHEGSGRKTLLRLMSGLALANRGKVIIRGHVRSVTDKVGVDRPLMSLRVYLETVASLLGAKRGEIKPQVEAALEYFGHSAIREVFLQNIPPAEINKLTYYLMLSVPADIYIFEVPPRGFCPELEEKVWKNGTIILLSLTPDTFKDADRVVLLSHGKLFFSGSVNEASVAYASLPPARTGLHLIQKAVEFEIEKPATEATAIPEVPRDAHANRKGSGVLRIESFRLLNSQNHEVDSIASGAPLKVELNYYFTGLNQPKKVASAQVILETETGQRVVGFHSEISTDFSQVCSQGRLICEIPALPLVPGRYGVTISIHVDQKLADKIVNERHLNIEFADLFGTGKLPPSRSGPLCLPAIWREESLTLSNEFFVDSQSKPTTPELSL